MKKQSAVSIDQMEPHWEGMSQSWECRLDDGNYLVVNDEGYWGVYPMPWAEIVKWWQQNDDKLPIELEIDGGYSEGDENDALAEFNERYPNDRAARKRDFVAGYMAGMGFNVKKAGLFVSNDIRDFARMFNGYDIEIDPIEPGDDKITGIGRDGERVEFQVMEDEGDRGWFAIDPMPYLFGTEAEYGDHWQPVKASSVKRAGKTTSTSWSDLLDQLQEKFGVEFSVPDYNGYCKYLYPVDSNDGGEWEIEVERYSDGTFEVMDYNARKLGRLVCAGDADWYYSENEDDYSLDGDGWSASVWRGESGDSWEWYIYSYDQGERVSDEYFDSPEEAESSCEAELVDMGLL